MATPNGYEKCPFTDPIEPIDLILSPSWLKIVTQRASCSTTTMCPLFIAAIPHGATTPVMVLTNSPLISGVGITVRVNGLPVI